MTVVAFGVPIAHLRAIAVRHASTLAASEIAVAEKLVADRQVGPSDLTAMLKFRAIAALFAACGTDPAQFRAALAEAEQLEIGGAL